MKFCIHHFPNGTIFQLNSLIRKGDDDGIRVVTGIVRNGPDSYVLETGRVSFIGHKGFQHMEGFNISHVERVLSRGDGPVEVDHGYFGAHRDAKLAEEIDWMEIRKPFSFEEKIREDSRVVDIRKMEIKPSSRNYTTGSAEALLIWEAAKLVDEEAMLNYSALQNAGLQQTWWKVKRAGLFHVHIINKKRLRRWLRQNINRFLISVKKQQNQDDSAVWGSSYLDDDFGVDRDPLPAGFVTNFDADQLPKYQEAVEIMNASCPGYEIRNETSFGGEGHSVWFFGNPDAEGPSFFQTLEKIEAREMRAINAEALQREEQVKSLAMSNRETHHG